MRLIFRRILLVTTVGFTLACSCSGFDQKSSEVKDRRPVADFFIPEKEPGRNYLHFIAIGDQGTGSSSQRHVAHLMSEKARVDSLDFVITLGDNFYRDGVTSVSDNQWVEKFEAIYDLPYLDVPFYASLGNHDHRNGNAHHQVAYGKTSDKWRMPNNYYTFSRAIDSQSAIQLFALDTEIINRPEKFDRRQIEWLEGELEASTATWKVVYGHHPVYSYGRHGSQARMIELVAPLLEKYDVDVYICGHDHDRQLLAPVNGVSYIVSGTGSKSRDTRYGETTIFAETNLGFAWFRVSADTFHLQLIDADGDVEFAHTWTKGAVARRAYKASESVGGFGAEQSFTKK